MLEVDQVTVIGTGLLGASVGLGLKSRGFTNPIVGVARTHDSADRALAVGAIDRGTDTVADALGDGPGSGLVVIAVPLGHFANVFTALAPLQRKGLVVTDVGSTKAAVCALAERLLERPGAFVPAHPMAGSEQHGPEHADADLFAGKPCILTPAGHTDRDALALVESLWTTLGMSLFRMSPADHDARTATVSHLPHALAALLMNVVEERGGLEIASTGLRSTSRLASGNPPMRADILTSNRDAVVDALTAFQCHLEALKAALQNSRDGTVLDTLTNAKAVRDRWLDSAEAGAADAGAADVTRSVGSTPSGATR